MKKILAILMSAAIALSLCSVSAFAADPVNLAIGATPICKDDALPVRNWGNGIATINNGDYSDRWQSETEVPMSDAALDANKEAWAGVQWETAQTFNTLKFYWEDSGSSENFRIEISDDAEIWTPVEYTNLRDGDGDATLDSGIKEIDTVTLNETATAKAVRIVIVQAQDTKNSRPSIYEFEVFNIEAAAEPVSFDGQLQLKSEDGTQRFVATNVYPKDVPAGHVIEATYTVTREGEAEPVTGSVIITKAYDSIIFGTDANATEISIGTVKDGETAGYVTGVLFTNVTADDVIEVSFAFVPAQA